MQWQRHLTSLVATIMVLDMLVVAVAFLPLPAATQFAAVDDGATSSEQTIEAGIFGCIWSCLKCVGTVGKNGKACRSCARCLGDEDVEPEASADAS